MAGEEEKEEEEEEEEEDTRRRWRRISRESHVKMRSGRVSGPAGGSSKTSAQRVV